MKSEMSEEMKNVTPAMLEEDLPPEFTRYRDDGCGKAARCLDCPFDKCLYEQPGGKKQFLKSRRDDEILRLHSLGRTSVEIARQYKVSERTVQRVVKSANGMKARRDIANCQIGAPPSPSLSRRVRGT